jgi:hypothetical protein
MAAAIGLRGDYDVGALRAAAKHSKDGPQARRLLALAAIYDGATRAEAAKIGGVGLQVVRDWVLKLNARGPDGLIDRADACRARTRIRSRRRPTTPRSKRRIFFMAILFFLSIVAADASGLMLNGFLAAGTNARPLVFP